MCWQRESGDDCICIKNRREYGEYGACENITVSNCTMVSTSCAIKLGSENVDVIRSIQFRKGREVFGELYFDYLQDISSTDAEKFREPQTDVNSNKAGQPETLWLSMLALQ